MESRDPRRWRPALASRPRLRGALRRFRAHRPLPPRAAGGGARGARRAAGAAVEGERSPVEAEPGRLALVRRKGAPSLAVSSRVHAIRGHRVLFDALLPHGAVVRLKSGVVKRIFWATPPLHVPRDLQRERPARRPRAQAAGRAARPPAAAGADRARALPRVRRPRSAAIECHRCPWNATPTCDHAWREIERLNERLHAAAPGAGGVPRRLLAGVPARRRGPRAVRRASHERPARAQGPPHRQPAPRQRAAGGRGGVAPALRRTSRSAEAAAVCSALLEESRSGRGR